MVKLDFLKIFHERGFFHQCTDEVNLKKLLEQGVASAYIGFDCTSTSLHVGSLIQIMILRWLQKSGHRPIILLGGGTTKVGDPSGKDETRQLKSEEEINLNMAGIKQLLEKFVDFSDLKTGAIIVNNDDWLGKINYIEFLRDYGRHFSVNKMLGFESVKLRLEREQHLSFLEFNYMILQAYDFVELYNKYGCRLQIGGSDQWGNIVNGIELHRRLNPAEDNSLYGLTTPLITTASGSKMGKSASGAVWLTENMLSTYDYWQFWRNTDDKDIGRFLRLFTELPIEEINELESLGGADINKAKIILANEATSICHGKDAAKRAEETALKTFEQGGIGDDLPQIEIKKSDIEVGIAAFKIIQMLALADSGKAAKRLIQAGGAKINDIKIEEENQIITLKDINESGVIKFSSGKKKHAIVKVI